MENGEWVAAALIFGHASLKVFDDEAVLTKRRFSKANITIYDLSVDPPCNFYANGILVHKKMF
ncbi:MAG: hypothetical protein CMI18_09980 [Opitutaceae bacterium]|nr:hypothetical protein [Opitutaceae bacterium]